jgi:potassium-transporting ATPase potassium-binding subunit
MSALSLLQVPIYLVTLLALAWPLGTYMASLYQGKRVFLTPVLEPVERLTYRLTGTRPDEEMDWRTYALAMLLFNALGLLVVYALQRLQSYLPLNPEALGPVTPDSSWNTAVSFVTNTNWQGYAGEVTMSYLTQMLGLTVQNFISAATGLAVMAAVVRGFARHLASTVGNFWVDLTRTTLYVLLPMALLLALILSSQGVVQSLSPYPNAGLLEPTVGTHGQTVTQQELSIGPAASQVAIKQLGTNGGGFFNVNSAHPFENPTPLSDFLELLAILMIPTAVCVTYGRMVGDLRQGWSLLSVMTIVFVAGVAMAGWAEQRGNPALAGLGVDQTAGPLQPGGNMEGKEARFGIADSALWATATTAASNGSVNAMHDSFTPLGGLVPLFMMQLGEIIYGGVGSGLYGMLAFVIVAVFIAGLMVGRTPEYLGKKIEAYEMKMAALMLLIPVLLVTIGTAVGVASPAGQATILNPGAHGFSEVLYAFSSAGNNNGSAFAGLGTNTPFYNTALGICMLFARYWLAIPALAMAGSLVRKKKVPASAGTLPTHTPLFIVWLIGVILIVGALSFIPALSLGPIAEYLMVGH